MEKKMYRVHFRIFSDSGDFVFSFLNQMPLLAVVRDKNIVIVLSDRVLPQQSSILILFCNPHWSKTLLEFNLLKKEKQIWVTNSKFRQKISRSQHLQERWSEMEEKLLLGTWTTYFHENAPWLDVK